MTAHLTPIAFRVRNFRNILDTGWIPLENINAFVGLNESGKTNLLQALHKFNPWEGEPTDPYEISRDFPRNHPKHDFIEDPDGTDWPVCGVRFQLSASLKRELRDLVPGVSVPDHLEVTRFYDGLYLVASNGESYGTQITSTRVLTLLTLLLVSVRSELSDTASEMEAKAELRGIIERRIENIQERFATDAQLHSPEGASEITDTLAEMDFGVELLPEEDLQSFQNAMTDVAETIGGRPPGGPLIDTILDLLPPCLYFEDYPSVRGTIDLNDYSAAQADPVRAAQISPEHAMARIGGVDAALFMGQSNSGDARRSLYRRSRAIQNTTKRVSEAFSAIYPFAEHTFRYDERNGIMTVQVSDNNHPGVETDIEERSKGVQSYFSFNAHFLDPQSPLPQDAILLFDEPGLHLHPTAQRSFVKSMCDLAERHTLLYTTHSPYMFSRSQIGKAKVVIEDDDGHATVVTGRWPEDIEEIFPFDEAIGYELMGDIVRRTRAILVEGWSDKIYLDGLRDLCERLGRESLDSDAIVQGCFGAPTVRSIARIFEARGRLPAVLLDADRAGDQAYKSLTETMYEHQRSRVMKLPVPDDHGDKPFEIEDFVGEDTVVSALRGLLGLQPEEFEIERETDDGRSIAQLIKKTAESAKIDLPGGPGEWKVEVAKQVVKGWEGSADAVPKDLLERAVSLFKRLNSMLDVEP